MYIYDVIIFPFELWTLVLILNKIRVRKKIVSNGTPRVIIIHNDKKDSDPLRGGEGIYS